MRVTAPLDETEIEPTSEIPQGIHLRLHMNPPTGQTSSSTSFSMNAQNALSIS
jgi:hypothetical protein